MADNNITIIGNITRDPEMRFTPGGTGVLTMSVACNRFWTDRNTGDRKEETDFFDVEAWGSLASNVADSVGKGSRVIINGRLKQKSWETESGEKRSRIVIVADEIGPSLRWATAEVTRQAGNGVSNSSGNAATNPAAAAASTVAEEPF